MEKFVKKPILVSFDALFLDPNNPRLAKKDQPGYEDANKLFHVEHQKPLEELVRNGHDGSDLATTIVAQGWMPLDGIIVWQHPAVHDQYVVVEGNRRTVALRDLRERLPKEKAKLESMKKKKGYVQHDLNAQADHVKKLERIINDTDTILVLPLDAKNVSELEEKLPRVLAVRHIQGARPWGNYAEDLWLLSRYYNLYAAKWPDKERAWDPDLVAHVGDEASITKVNAKRRLQAASAFSHFRAEYEDKLPGGDEFKPKDYYVFENIVKKPWLREQFGLSADGFQLGREDVLFKWVFQKERGHTAEDNENVFYRQENVLLWDKIHRYDADHETSFAARFDVESPDEAPQMEAVEAAYLNHRTRSAPSQLLEQLLDQLKEVPAEMLVSQADFLKPLLEEVSRCCTSYLTMMVAAANPSPNK